ncbi:RNA polymerase III-inhibiting protein maf1, partial [Cladochytrium tenue]
KSTNEDKKLRQHIDAKYDEEAALNASLEPGSGSYLSPVSPFGPMSQPTPRKTLLYLVGTLNSAFPDYDFSDISPAAFAKLPAMSLVERRLQNTLFNVSETSAGRRHRVQAMHAAVWSAVDEVIHLADCDIYEFQPDPESEPDVEEGGLYMAPMQPEELPQESMDDAMEEPLDFTSDT